MPSPASPLSPESPELSGFLNVEQLETLRTGLRLMALRRLGDADLADEVAQETLARTVAAIRGGRAGDIQSLGAFVHGIARHVIVDVTRSNQRQGGSDGLAKAPDPATLDRDALGLVISNEEGADVRAALARLDASDREILHLSFYEGLTPAEVALRLNKDPVVIRKRKSRALERLRAAFLAATTGHAGRLRPTPIVSDRAPQVAGPEVSR